MSIKETRISYDELCDEIKTLKKELKVMKNLNVRLLNTTKQAFDVCLARITKLEVKIEESD